MPVDDNIVIEGPYGRIEYAVRIDGTRPARKDLEKIKKKKSEKSKYFAFIALFEQYVNTGSLPSKYLDDYNHDTISGILKFKRHDVYPYRIVCFKEIEDNGRIENYVLTHIFKKRENDGNQIKKEVKLADKIRSEHKQRKIKQKGLK